MKWLFYLLALANSGVLALQYWYLPPAAPETSVPVARSETSTPRLVLVSELEQAPKSRPPAQVVQAVQASPPPKVDQAVSPAPGAPPVCFRISGLPDEGQANALAGRLRLGGAEIRGRHLVQEVEHRYWVSLPPFPSRAAAEPTIRRLQRGGIRDHYFVNADPNRNAISLGVFSNPQGAERRRAQVARLGLAPRVESVEAPIKVYALTLALPSDKALTDFELGEWADRVEETSCP